MSADIQIDTTKRPDGMSFLAVIIAVLVVSGCLIAWYLQSERDAGAAAAERRVLDTAYHDARNQHVIRQPGDAAFIPFTRPPDWKPGYPMPWGPRQYAPDPNR